MKIQIKKINKLLKINNIIIINENTNKIKSKIQ